VSSAIDVVCQQPPTRAGRPGRTPAQRSLPLGRKRLGDGDQARDEGLRLLTVDDQVLADGAPTVDARRGGG